MAEWWQEIFDASYLQIYAHMDRRGEEHAGQVADRLGLAPGAEILDLCGGYGRIAIPLALRGYRMTVLDLSEHFLAEGRRRAAGAEIEWIHADMREIPAGRQFDAVINMFTAFGYFSEEAENARVIAGVAAALRPGGLFLMDVAHRDMMLHRGVQRWWDEMADWWLLEQHNVDLATSRMRTQRTLLPKAGGEPRREEHDLRLYAAHEVQALCRQAGLEVIDQFGGLDGARLTRDSWRLVTLARRPA